MLLQVSEFRRRVDTGMDELVTELAEQTGRGGYAEKDAWKASFRAVRDAFSEPSFDELDVFFGSRGNLALEYRMPGGSGWADMVLLGRHEEKPASVLIELKNWITQGDLPGIGEGLMNDEAAWTNTLRHRLPAMLSGAKIFTPQFKTVALTSMAACFSPKTLTTTHMDCLRTKS